MNKNYMIFYLCLVINLIFVASDSKKGQESKPSCICDNVEYYITPGSLADQDLQRWVERSDKVFGKQNQACISALVHGTISLDSKISGNERKK